MVEKETPFRDSAFCVIDFETTGFDPSAGHRACEVALVRVAGGRVESAFTSLLCPSRAVPRDAAAVHGLTDKLLARAPSFGRIFPQVRQFADGARLAAHNALFDEAFLLSEAAAAGAPLPETDVLDTLQLSRLIFPHEARHRLCDLAERLGVAPGIHSGLSDAVAMASALSAAFPILDGLGLSTSCLAPLSTRHIRRTMDEARKAAASKAAVVVRRWWPRGAGQLRGRIELERRSDRFVVVRQDGLGAESVYASFVESLEEAS